MDKKRKLEIGKRVEQIRITKLNCISKTRLANEIGMSRQGLALILTGSRAFSLESLIAFCEYANVSLDYVIYGKK